MFQQLTFMKLNRIYSIKILLVFHCLFLILPVSESTAQSGTQYHAVIIRAAGYLPGTEKPTGEDAITHATSKPGNTYIFSEKLSEELTSQDIETKSLIIFNAPDLSCLENNDTKSAVDIVIFAGPSYNRKLPAQFLPLISKLKDHTKSNPHVLCSSLISANFTYRGIITMEWVDEQLKKANAKTITGLVFNSDVIQKEVDEDMKDFVASLKETVKR